MADPLFNLSNLNGSNGFTINGINASDSSGTSVSNAGDINGDGIDDLIIGAPGAGQSYVVFGSTNGFNANLDLSSLNGSNGFAINGSATNSSGLSVSDAGDINGDNIDDLIIGAPGAALGAGQSYVVFGSTSTFNASLDLSSLDGSNGFAINGINGVNSDGISDSSGKTVSSAGDINGDNIDDLIIGAPDAASGAGQSYVVFGSTSAFSASFDLSSLDGSNGFAINGSGTDTSSNSISSAGDINGDNIGDLIIGAQGTGKSYVVFGGGSAFSASFDQS
jgi:FG-GAP repeat